MFPVRVWGYNTVQSKLVDCTKIENGIIKRWLGEELFMVRQIYQAPEPYEKANEMVTDMLPPSLTYLS